MIPFASISWTAVAASTVAALIIGTLWYGPLFGEQWMKLVGLTKKDGQKDMGKTMVMGIFNTIIMLSALNLILLIGAPASLADAFCLTGLVWLGFVVTDNANSAIWARGPWKLFLINSTHALVTLLVAAWIIMTLS